MGEHSKAAIITAEAGIARAKWRDFFVLKLIRDSNLSGDGRRNSICPIRMIRERARNECVLTFESNRAG